MKIEDFLNMPQRAVIATFYVALPEFHQVNDKEDIWLPFVREGDQATLGLVDREYLMLLEQNTSVKKSRYIPVVRHNLYSVDIAVLHPLCIATENTDAYLNFLGDFKRGEAPLGLGEQAYDAVVYVPSLQTDMRRELTLLDPKNQILSCRFLETIET